MATTLQTILSSLDIPIFGISSVPKKENWRQCRGVSRIPQHPQSLIICIFPYNIGDLPRNVSRYAIMLDYHRIIEKILEEASTRLKEHYGGSFVPFVDNSPFAEKICAAQCGLGAIGWNSLLIVPPYGSYVFIGEIVTDVKFPPAPPSPIKACLQCGKCRKACPAGALSDTGLARDKCLSAVTQKKGELTSEEQARIQKSGCIWGCDICQDVCPMNKDAALSPIKAFYEDVLPIIHSVPADYKMRAYGYRGRRVLERNISLINKKT